MKFLGVRGKKPESRAFVYAMGSREQEFFFLTLMFYPLMDINTQPLSRNGVVDKDHQQVLDEAMAETRLARRKKLDQFLEKKTHIKKMASGDYQLKIKAEEIEWLLQVFNEIRVGCWIKLGRPDIEKVPETKPTEDQARDQAAMELCAHFQMSLLEAFNGGA